ncbi:diguanylate cyclase [Mycoplasmatota bacterium]|nr:diguanylate cyclase [Mycoplasmatota bacterium]
MTIYLWLIYLVLAIVSFLPIVRIDVFSTNKKYKYFKYLSMTIFIWSLIIGFRYIITNPLFLYYMIMLMYPVVLTATILVFLSLMHYIEKVIPLKIKIFFLMLIIIEVVVVLTNSSHQLFIKLAYSDNINEEMLRTARIGLIYYIHVVFSYMLLFISTILILRKLYIQMKDNKDYLPFFIFVFSIIVGVLANAIHVFVYSFVLDPTYMAFVVLTTVIYFVIYIRDVRLILKLDNHQFILNNLREMYLVINHKGFVVDASKALAKKFDLNLNQEDISFDDFMTSASSQAIIYSSAKNMPKEYDKNKDYLHMQTKDINMPFLKFSGHLVLFYDETKIQKYIHDMDYVINHDSMTDIYNRNYLEDIRKNYYQNDQYAIVIFDLDALKLMNDYLGHRAGDELLIRFSKILKRLADENEGITPIRLGGDEFLLIICNRTKKEIEEMMDDIKNQAYNKNPLKNIGFSYGIATNKGGKSFDKVMSKADMNMYEMKETRTSEKLELEKTLKSKSHNL